jgi:hypothetical protein
MRTLVEVRFEPKYGRGKDETSPIWYSFSEQLLKAAYLVRLKLFSKLFGET